MENENQLLACKHPFGKDSTNDSLRVPLCLQNPEILFSGTRRSLPKSVRDSKSFFGVKILFSSKVIQAWHSVVFLQNCISFGCFLKIWESFRHKMMNMQPGKRTEVCVALNSTEKWVCTRLRTEIDFCTRKSVTLLSSAGFDGDVLSS